MTTNYSSETLSQQIDQYILELQNIQLKITNKQPNLPHLTCLNSKITAKLVHFQNASQLIRFNSHSVSSLKHLSSHLSTSFSQIVKEAHRLLQLKTSQNNS